MQKRNFLKDLWSSFRRSRSEIIGSPYPLGYGISRNHQRRNLDVPETPVRYVEDNSDFTQRLIEIKHYSKEVSKAFELMSLNCFQSQNGGSGSWKIKQILSDGSSLNPDVIAIAQNLISRSDGDDSVIGGDILQSAVLESLFYGDSFFQLGVEKQNGEWGISSSIYMPPLSMFSVRNDSGKLIGYYQEQIGSSNRIDFHPFKIIQFSYLKRKGTRYGKSYLPRSQAFQDWDNLRDAEDALSKVSIEAGIAPWLHTLPEGRSQQDLDRYQRRHQEALNNRLPITNYYLLNGADIRKAANNSDAIAPLAHYLLDCRRRMIPAGFPAWIFTELGYEAGSGNDLNGQPAMTYAQLVAAMRSMLGQGIKKAIAIELLLKKGYDWYVENSQFEIEWEPWIATPGQLAMHEAVEEP